MIKQNLSPHITLYSIHYNKPHFIKWQFDSFYKFLQNPFQLIIVNNARTNEMRLEINKAATELNLISLQTYSDIPFDYAGAHHASAINNVWQNSASRIKGLDIVGVMDGDIFLLDFLKLGDNDWSIMGAPQHRKGHEYITPTIVFLNMKHIKSPEELDWEGIKVEGTETHLDTGGGFYNYFNKYPEVKKKCWLLNQSWHISERNVNTNLLPKEIKACYKEGFDVELFGNKFLHYCRSSGWNPKESEEFHKEKEAWVKDFVYKCIYREIIYQPKYFNICNDNLGWRIK